MSDTSLIFTIIGRDRSGAALNSAATRMNKLKVATAAGFGVIAGVVASSVSKAAEFDKTIRLAGAAADVASIDLKSMSDIALKMGSATQFGAQGAADAMLELAKGGISLAEMKAGALAGTMTLASAGGLELGAAATYMTNTLSTFGLEADSAAAVAAALAGGANASTASVESLGMALGQVGPGASNAGLAMEETVAVLAAFDQAGVKGSDAGTSLKTMLTRLVPATDKAAAAMDDLNLDFTKADGSFVSISEVAQQLQDGLGGLSEEQRTMALTTMFGSDATRAATILMKNGEKGLGKYIKATKDRTAAEKMAKEQTSGAAGNMKKFTAAVDSLQIAFGLHLLPAVTKVTEGVTGLVTAVTEKVDPAFDKLSGFAETTLAPAFDKVKDAVGKIDFSGIGAKLGGDAKEWASEIIGGIKTGFDTGDWSGLGTSIGDGIGTALSGAGMLAINFTSFIGEQIKKVNWMDLAVEFGKQVPTLLMGLIIGILNFDVMGLLRGLGDHWFEVILGIITIAFLPVKVIAVLGRILSKIPFVGKLLAWLVTGIHKGARWLLKGAWNLLKGFGRGFMDGIRRVFPTFGTAMGNGLRTLWDVLRSRGAGFILVAREWAGKLLKGLAALPMKLLTLGGRLIGQLLAGLVRYAPRMFMWFLRLPGKILGMLAGLAVLLFPKGRELLSSLWDGIKEKAPAVWNWFKKLPGRIWDAAKRLAVFLHPRGIQMLKNLWDGIKKKAPDIWNWFKKLPGRIWSAAKRLAVFLHPRGVQMLKNLWDGIKKKAPDVLDWFAGLPKKILGKIGDLTGTLVQKGKDLVQGFIDGIEEKAKDLPGVIKDNLVDKATSVLTGPLGFIMRSPSRLTMRYGRWFVEGFAIGVKDSQKKVIDQAQKLVDKLKEKLKTAKDFAKEIKASFSESANLTSLDYTGEAGSLLAQLQAKADDAVAFQKGIAELRKKGLNEPSLRQIREAGPDGGMAAMEELLNGGDVRAVNKLVKQITDAGGKLGNREAKEKFGIDPSKKQKVRVKVDGVKIEFSAEKGGDEFLRWLRKTVRAKGGNVQTVIGT